MAHVVVLLLLVVVADFHDAIIGDVRIKGVVVRVSPGGHGIRYAAPLGSLQCLGSRPSFFGWLVIGAVWTLGVSTREQVVHLLVSEATTCGRHGRGG